MEIGVRKPIAPQNGDPEVPKAEAAPQRGERWRPRRSQGLGT
jgi:hypothetical protein